MPTSRPRGSFCPPNDNATYRDLLMFEERLKTNAASLKRRKSRYQLFLFQLLLVIAFLLIEMLLPPQSSLLAIPYKLVLQRLLPDLYAPNSVISLHPYFTSGLLFVSVTTLVLFFVSGMYSEKIAYANRYVPHANRALRSLNMYLNVRKPPLRSKFYFNPLSFFFPRPEPPNGSSSRPPSPPSRSSSQSRSRSGSTSIPISPIPPAVNPRGELIFSPRVDKSFRESYERYRAAFERKREEKERMEKGNGWLHKLSLWDQTISHSARSGGSAANSPMRTISSSSSRGRGGSRSSTPPGTSGASGSGVIMRQRERSRSPMRQRTGTPPGNYSSPGLTRQGNGSQRDRNRREPSGVSDMRTMALERSMSRAGEQQK